MKKLLEYLASHGAFLYEDFDCRITDSKYDPAFGGGGSVTLVNDVVEIRLWLERERLFLDLRGAGQRSAESWFSLDISKQLLTGAVIDDAALNAENTAFLKYNFSEVLKLFSPNRLAETESKCKKLEKQRSKRLFG